MNQKTVTLDFRWISLILLGVIAVMLTLWQPWQGVNRQTITVTGEAKVKAAPDEFTFMPAYQKEATTSTAAISEVSKVGNAVVAKLKELGFEEKNIATNVNANPGFEPLSGRPNDKFTGVYNVTAKTQDKDLAQKALDYLVTTNPIYGVSPMSNFSDEKRKELESQARGRAIADAKAKADQTTSGLGLKTGRVVSISEPTWGGPIPLGVAETKSRDMAQSNVAPVLLTGEQDVTYSIQVVFRFR